MARLGETLFTASSNGESRGLARWYHRDRPLEAVERVSRLAVTPVSVSDVQQWHHQRHPSDDASGKGTAAAVGQISTRFEGFGNELGHD